VIHLLSPVEQAYLQDREQFSKVKQRYVRYRLRKKLRSLGQELGGIDNNVISVESCAAAANRDALVAQPGRAKANNNDDNEKSPRWDLDHDFLSPF
jgi:hypothetical protein